MLFIFDTKVLKSGDDMKKGYLKLIIFQILMILIILFSSFVLNILDNNIKKIVFWLLILITLKILSGLEKDKSLNKTDILLEVFIFSFIYVLLEYVLGFFLGFVKNPYNLQFLSIIKNITPVLVLIILEELSRYIIISKGKGNKIIPTLCVIFFTIFDTLTSIGLYDITSKAGVFDAIILTFLPSISKNILLCYISSQGGYKPTILYRGVLELIIFLVPIYADLGNYLDSILKIVLPLIFLFRLILLLKKRDKQDIRSKSNKNQTIIITILIIILGIIVSLVSGYFKYYLLVIASGSMEPNINIGDSVLVEKLNSDELYKLKKGDVLAYQYEEKILVHRITEIKKIDNKYVFKTKGDNNEDEDNWLIYDSQIIGKVNFRIRYIGYPTVLLNNYLNK